MNLRVTDTSLPICEVADILSEQPIDCDFLLPEYCPDVAAVLKCNVRVGVQNRVLHTDRFSVEGTVWISVLYLDEERQCVHSCDFSQPFGANMTLPLQTGETFTWLTTEVNYVNCRAVSPRRLDIHGAFTLRLQRKATAEWRAVSDLSGDKVYCRKMALNGTVPASSAEKTFLVNEATDFGQSKKAAEQMLRVNITPVVTDCKVMQNKAIVKGRLAVNALYLTDSLTGETDSVSGEIPFSQIVDMEGLCDEWLCDAHIHLISADLTAESAPSGEHAMFTVNAKMTLMLQGWREVNGEVLSDAYACNCPLTAETHTAEVYRLKGVWRDERTVRQSVESPSDTLAAVLDVWCDVVRAGMSQNGNEATLEGQLLWRMLVREENGECGYYERTEALSLPYADGGVDETPVVTVCAASGTVNGSGKPELKADLQITRRPAEKTTCTALTSVFADDAAAYPPEKATLKVCYVAGGESIWEIAKKYHTSAELIMEENRLTEERLAADTMLLIPIR